MTPASIIAQLARLGVSLTCQGDKLRFHPVETVTPTLLEAMRQHKPALLALARQCHICGSDKWPAPWGEMVCSWCHPRPVVQGAPQNARKGGSVRLTNRGDDA